MVRVVDINDVGVRLLEARDKDELLGSIHRVFVPETRPVVVQQMVAIAEGRTSYESEAVIRTLNGTRLTVLLTMTFPPPPARIDRVLVTIVDITERKRAEYLTGHVFEVAPDAVYIVGRDYRYQRGNAVFQRRWKMPADRLVGVPASHLPRTEPPEETYPPT